jgi:serine/threonine protein phosphatase 1
MPWYYELKDYVLVHAGLNFDETDVFSDTESMVWIRDYRYDGEKVGNKIIVHGHTPLPLERIIKHLSTKMLTSINLDAGCVYNDIPGYGNLVALDLDSRELFVQENVDM